MRLNLSNPDDIRNTLSRELGREVTDQDDISVFDSILGKGIDDPCYCDQEGASPISPPDDDPSSSDITDISEQSGEYTKRKQYHSTESSTYRGYSIYHPNPKKYAKDGQSVDTSSNTKILDAVINHTEDMTKRHSRVLSTRLDIHSPADTDSVLSGDDIRRVVENTKRNIVKKAQKSSRAKPDIAYIWAQEQTSPDKDPHYHLQFLCNGNAIKNGYTFKEELDRQVERRMGKKGLVHFSESNDGSSTDYFKGKAGLMIDRSSPYFEEQKAAVVKQGSYLAKSHTKEYTQKHTRTFSASRLPR